VLDALIVAVWLAAGLALAWTARRRGGAEDYVLASRALTLPAFVSTLVPTFYGGVLGIGEFTWGGGLSNWTVMAAPYYVFAALYAVFLAGRVRAEPGLSIPDHLEGAYGKRMALLGAALVFLLACPADEVLMAGKLLTHLTGLGALPAMSLAAALAAALVWRGGLPSDVAANRLQIVGMFAGFAVILPFCVMRLGGPAALAAALPPGHLTWTGGLGPWKLLGWWLVAVWTLVDPAFHQRCAAAESPATARRGILWSIAFWALFDLMTTAAGLYARAALPALDDATLAFPRLADAVLPPLARGVFLAGCASSLFAALQATTLLSAASLGKDGAARWLGREGDGLRWTRLALPLSAVLAVLLARLVPSVTGLWYAVGSACIPGLLLPMLGVYFPRGRAAGAWAFASSAAGFGLSLLWVALARRGGAPPLGLEPMFPGLAAAGALWALGLPR
jgi:SSS family solute:Na+ symporter